MGQVCGSNMTSTLMKNYGTDTILQYCQSIMGNNIIGSQSSTLRNLITQKFNASPQAVQNPGLLDQVLGQVKNAEAAEKSKIMALKPSIPELDNASQLKQNSFVSSIANKFPTQMNSFKETFTNQITSSLSPQKFLSMAGLS